MQSPIALTRFTTQLTKLETIFSKANKTKNSAEYLFVNGARTPIFMLEALLRVDRKVYTKNNLEQWYNEFKFLEDAIGTIDYYDYFGNELKKRKNISPEIIRFFTNNKEQSVAKLNAYLEEKNWQPDYIKKTNEFLSELKAVNWKTNDEEVVETISDEIKKAESFINEELKYTDVELSTHELRRKLRWISIYCQAFGGLFQLRNHPKSAQKLQNYLTPEIINSPFNVLPKSKTEIKTVNYKNNYFYALSWVINELGTIKDKGLQVLALSEALHTTKLISEKKAITEACVLLKEKENCIELILAETEKLNNLFSENQVLSKLKKDLKKYSE